MRERKVCEQETETGSIADCVMEWLSVGAITPSPNNPRMIDEKSEALKELAASIKALGVLHPILVRPMDGTRPVQERTGPQQYELIAGERRWRAAKLAGLSEIPAIVRVLDDKTALEMTVTENLQREQLHPLEEARGVASLIAGGWTHDQVASQLGKPARWVARRAALTRLTKGWQKLIAGGKPEGWAAPHFEVIAPLLPSVQDEVLRDVSKLEANFAGIPVRQLREDIEREYLQKLSSAPWKLTDSFPGFGEGNAACSMCLKRSSVEPELFDVEHGEAKNAKVPKGDRCLDAACWGRKFAFHNARKFEELKREHGDVVVVVDYQTEKEAQKELKGAKLVNRYAVSEGKKSQPGATPALDYASGRVRWLAPREKQKSAVGKGACSPMSLAEKRKQLERQRDRLVVERVIEAIEERMELVDDNGMEYDPLGDMIADSTGIDVLPLVAVFGTEVNNIGSYNEPDEDSRADWARVHGMTGWDSEECRARNVKTASDRVFGQVLGVIVKRLRSGLRDGPPPMVEAEEVCKLLKLPLELYMNESVSAKPEPKSWAEEEAAKGPLRDTDGKPSKKKAAKGKGAKKAVKSKVLEDGKNMLLSADDYRQEAVAEKIAKGKAAAIKARQAAATIET